jgi:hypothetical protein
MPDDGVANKVRVMLAAVDAAPQCRTFASEHLVTTTNKPDWMPPKGARVSNFFLSILIVALVGLMLVLWMEWVVQR